MKDKYAREFSKRTDEYDRRVQEGTWAAKDLKVTFCVLARDCADNIPRFKLFVKGVSKLFKECRVLVVENDSVDGTRTELMKVQEAFPTQTTLSFLAKGNKKWGMVRDPARGDDMAYYRNYCRKYAISIMPDADYYIPMDSDLAAWSIDGLCHTLSYAGEFDVMFSNGLRKDKGKWVQYDAWAWRENTWSPVAFKTVKNRVFDLGDPLVPMLSAFGGMAVYSGDAYRACEYTGGDCEHVGLHRNIRRKGYKRVFINPSQIMVVRW